MQVLKLEKIMLLTTHQQMHITTQKIKKVCKLRFISHAWYIPLPQILLVFQLPSNLIPLGDIWEFPIFK